ncbi:hypothetical protein CI109_105586 [Kwoniella shandongensis]|uniref:Uncharacterized protein n=1 Tax=Kwoniella shandongensis TaxID=1734106 RepID=A0A5M6C3X0_9TREE|nr:uncharacterized protein CI109_002303 [Kwoniella shandongensis]KAA5529410.1 hypothetical protein CI109_002303 [Kwoniella shandongensis]
MPSNTFATSGRDLVGHRIDNGRLEFLAVLGVGAYGVVYLAVDLHAPKPVYLAVKCLLRAGLDSRQRHFQRREIALHQLASRHPNVVTLHKVFEEGDYVFVVMDFCDEGDLFGMITERQRYLGNDNLIKRVFLQIVDAVDYCHRMGIFHRDLKPENILCTSGGEKICIADFGLATSERHSTDFGCGSTFYLSPECQGGLFERLESYSTETNDVWSLGVILVNLTCGRNPWRQACPSDETFRAYVHNSDFLRTILPISHATNQILKGLFALEPQDRTSLKVLREQILRVDRFTMTDEELKTAHSAARAAAAAVRQPVTPVCPAVEVIAPAPAVPQVEVHITTDGDSESSEDLDEFAAGHDQARAKASARLAVNSNSWSSTSTSSAFSRAQIDKSVFAQIDFSPASSSSSPQQATMDVDLDNDTPQLISNDVEYQLHMSGRTGNSSRSSSSGDVSLPPTPDFQPIDVDNKTGNVQAIPVPRWELAMSIGEVVGRKGQQKNINKDLLHVNSLNPSSPLSGEFSI